MTHTYGIAPAGYRLPAETHIGAVRLQVSNALSAASIAGATSAAPDS